MESPSTRNYSTSKKLPQYFSALSANIGGFVVGSSMFFSATALPDIKRSAQFGILSKYEESLFTSAVFFGALFSSFTASFCMKKFGRKLSLLILTIPYVMAWAVIAFADSLLMIYCGRFTTGLCGGLYGLIVPVFIAETVEVSIRCTLSSLFEFMVCCGALLIYIFGTFTPWNIHAMICGFIPIIFHLLIMMIPESPRFLLEQNKPVAALKALCWYRGAKSALETFYVEQELFEMQVSVDKSALEKKGWKSLTETGTLRSLLTSLGLTTFLQMTFINPILANLVEIFQDAGSYDAYLSTIIVGVMQTMASIIPTILSSRLSRRVLLSVSFILISLSLVILGVYFHLKYMKQSHDMFEFVRWLPITSLIIYGVATSVGKLPKIIAGPNISLNTKGSEIILIWSRIVGLATVFFYRDLLEIFRLDGGYWFIASFCGIGFLFVFFCKTDAVKKPQIFQNNL